MVKKHYSHQSRTTDRRTGSEGSRADRAGATVNDGASFVGQNSRAEDRCELLEVQGFDLLAQIEAMFRHAREYQREMQRLRGLLGKGQTETADLPPMAAVRHHIEEMHQALVSFGETLADARNTLDSLRD